MEILTSLNTVITKIYSSIDSKVYDLLDKVLVIDNTILEEEPLSILFSNNLEGFGAITSCVVIMLVVCFAIRKIIQMYTGEAKIHTYKFILKLIIFSSLTASSYYICETILNINGLLSNVIVSIGEDLTGTKVSFEELSECVKQLQDNSSSDFVSLDGIIKGLLGFGSVTLLLNLSTRYVIIILLIILSPIMFMLMVGEGSKYIVSSWIKMFLSNILMQDLILFVLLIPLASQKINEDMFKIILVGTIYILYKINNYSTELLSQFKLGKEA